MLAYQEYGNKNGPMMVFLHGGGVSSWMWEDQVHYFNHYHCITVDLPECGNNKNIGPFSIHSSAKEVNQLVKDKANGKTVIIVGFSLGAQVAIELLCMEPTFYPYAVINSALVRPNVFYKKMIKPSIKLTFPLVKNKYFARLQAKILYIDDRFFEKYYFETTEMKSDTLIRILEENLSFQLPEHFQKVKTKILVTVGEKENGMMKKSAKDLILANNNCTGIVFLNIGHGAPLANPKLFNQTIDDWLQDGTILNDARVIE